MFVNVGVYSPYLDQIIKLRTSALAALEIAIASNRAAQLAARSDGKTATPTPLPVDRNSQPVGLYFLKKYCSKNVLLLDAEQYWRHFIELLDQEITRLQIEGEAVVGDSNRVDIKSSQMESGVTVLSPVTLFEVNVGNVLTKLKDKFKKKIMSPVSTGTAYITFRSRRTQAMICQVPLLFEQYPGLTVSRAPTPSDMLWENLSYSTTYTSYASIAVTVLLYSGLLFWSTIVAFVAAVSSLANLATYLPFINDLDPVLYALIAGNLPVVVNIIFQALIPIVIGMLAHYIERRKSRSAVELHVFRWYFLYQVINIFVLVLSGSVFTSIANIIASPTSAVTLLGAALPTVSVFFINFMITQLLSGIPSLLLRLSPLATFKLYKMLFKESQLTQRMLFEGPLADSSVSYGTVLPAMLYVLTLAVVYWVIAPILSAIAAVFFVLTYLAYKYQYVHLIIR